MDRPLWKAGVVTALVFAVVVFAASSGPVRLWVVAPSTGSGSIPIAEPSEQDEAPTTATPDDDDRREWPKWIGTALQIVLVVLAIVVVVAFWLIAVRRPPRLRPRHWRGRRAPPIAIEPLPEVAPLAVDLDAAHLALVGGDPSDAIIACWMQLERDAADAGLPRLAHETSAEYVERVVARASVDPAPIGELAMLYREARFSRHDLGDGHRERAREALQRVEAALRHKVGAGR